MPPLSQEQLASRIRSMIDAAGLKHGEVAKELKLSPSALSRALSGQRNFKTLEIAKLANLLSVSTEHILFDGPASEDGIAIAARTQSRESPAISAANNLVLQAVQFDSLLRSNGYPAYNKIPEVAISAGVEYVQGEKLAEDVLAALELHEHCLPASLDDLYTYIECVLGVDIYVDNLPLGLDGLSVRSGSFTLIVISSSISAARQRYTMAHEIGHLCARDTQNILIDEDIYGSRLPSETRANSFAAAFLMPSKDIRRDCDGEPEIATEEFIGKMLGKYRVSLDALAFRLNNLQLIDANQRDLVRSFSSKKIAMRDGRASDLQARNERRVPGLLLDRALHAYSDGRISVRPIAKLLEVEPEQLLDELAPASRQTRYEDSSYGGMLRQ